MRIKRSISFFLLLSLLISSVTGLLGEKAEAAVPPELSGEIVLAQNGYHDTWTAAWEGYSNNPKLYGIGTDNPNNLNKSYDRGKPLSNQSTDLTLDATAFVVTSAEEFKKQFRVVPLYPASLEALGMTSAEAEEFITKALSPSVSGSMQGATYDAYLQKYVDIGVSNLSIDNDGITMDGNVIKVPASYKLEAVQSGWDSNKYKPYGIDMRNIVMDPYTGILANVRQYKSNGWPYSEFRKHQSEFYSATENVYQELWNTETLGNGVVGWRWYIPFAVIRIAPSADLKVTGLTVDIDQPTGDITCEASVENSFLENLKNVQLEWILETPKGTIFKTETLEGKNILKDAQSFITKQKFTGVPQGQGGSCTFRINLKDPDTDRMTFEDGTLAVESDYTNNIGYAEFDPAEIDIQMSNLTATPSSSKTGSFSIKADYVLQSIVSDDTYANALVGKPLELVLSVGGVQTKKSVAFDAGLTGNHTFNISGIPVPPVGTRSYQVEAWINHPDATDMEIDKDVTDVKARNNYMTTMISTEGAAPPPIPPTSVCITGKSVNYDLRYTKRTCKGSSCTYNYRPATKKRGPKTSKTTVYHYEYKDIDKSYTHAGTSSKTIDIVQAGVIAPTVRYNGNTPVFRSGYWHTPYVVTLSKVTHEDNSTITLPGFGADQKIQMTTSLSETAGAEGSKPSLKLERVYRRSIYELGGKEQKGGETVSIPDTLIGPVSVNLPSPVGKSHDWKEEDIRCTILGGSRSGNRGTCEPTSRMNEMYNYPQDYVDPAIVRAWRAEGIGSSGAGGSGQEVYYSEAVDFAVYMPPVLAKASDMYTTTGNPQSITMADLKQNKSIIALMSKIDGKTASTSNHKDKLKNEILAAILKGVKDNRVVHINYKERDGEYTYNITGDCGMGGSTKFQLEGSVFDDIN